MKPFSRPGENDVAAGLGHGELRRPGHADRQRQRQYHRERRHLDDYQLDRLVERRRSRASGLWQQQLRVDLRAGWPSPLCQPTRVPGAYTAKILGSGEVVPVATPPIITAQPASQVAVAGNNVTFTAAATGTPAPAYQWLHNGTNLPAATAPALLLTNVTVSQAGSHSVTITNVAGSINSSTAVLSVYATAAPTLSGAGYLANGQFHLNLTGAPGYSYAVWGSTDLNDWTPLQTNVSPFMFSDTNVFRARFYRAQYLP